MPNKGKEMFYFIDQHERRTSKDGIEFLEVYLSNYYEKRKVYLWESIDEFEEKAKEQDIILCNIQLKKEKNKIYHIVDYEFREFLVISLDHLYGLRDYDLGNCLLEMLYHDITDEFLLDILRVTFKDRKVLEKFFQCPASLYNHHNYPMGLVEHTVKAMRLAEDDLIFRRNWDLCEMDNEIILMSIFFHDLGKVVNYKVGKKSYNYNMSQYYLHHADLSYYYLLKKGLGVRKNSGDRQKLYKMASCILYHHKDSRQGYRKDIHNLIQRYDIESMRLNNVHLVPTDFYENYA
ncbi:hypothetical protein [Flexistipes sp.]|uniref:hypothetical protein n=1 Tax=Flexistipes sp. TaxID=3088135 RepID=UPI002E1A1623|nr:hypothetical protein [Flexistipes sp.]